MAHANHVPVRAPGDSETGCRVLSISDGSERRLSGGAARGMGAELARRFAGEGTSTVHPRYIRSPVMTAALAPEQIKVASASVPIHRFGEVADVSNLLAFLASDEAGFVTGSEYIIDGGLSAL